MKFLLATAMLFLEAAGAEPHDYSKLIGEVWTFEADKGDLLKAGFPTTEGDWPGASFPLTQSGDKTWISLVSNSPSYKEIYRAELSYNEEATGEVNEQKAFDFPSSAEADGMSAHSNERKVGMLVRSTLEEADARGHFRVWVFAEHISFEGWIDPDVSTLLIVSDDPKMPAQNLTKAENIFGIADSMKSSTAQPSAGNDSNFIPIFSTHLIDTTVDVLLDNMAILSGNLQKKTKELSNGEVNTISRGTFTVLLLREKN